MTHQVNTLHSSLTARTRDVPVSMEPSLLSPIFTDTICAPGAMPLRSGASGKQPVAMHATWVPWEPGNNQPFVSLNGNVSHFHSIIWVGVELIEFLLWINLGFVILSKFCPSSKISTGILVFFTHLHL